MEMQLRPASARGLANIDWLNSRHTFSFGHYFDPAHMGFGALRVINEDRVVPGAGFDTHGHRDMEIVSYVLDGALEHKDSIGTGSVIRPGEIQRMTAGSGIRHSEFNHSNSEEVHFLQIWIIPEKEGLEPGYEQIAIPAPAKGEGLTLIGSRDGRNGSVTIHQDVSLYAGRLSAGAEAAFENREGRQVWIQVARGGVAVNGRDLSQGDGLAVTGEGTLSFATDEAAEFLLFDLAA